MENIQLVRVEDMKGFRIEVGIDIIPADVRKQIIGLNTYLDRCKELKITNNGDYYKVGDELKNIKGIKIKIEGLKNELMAPVNELKDKIMGEINPLEQNTNYTISCMKATMLDWNAEMTKKRNEEKEKNKIKAKEEEERLKKDMEPEIIGTKRQSEILEIQRKAKIEDRKEFERKKIDIQRDVHKTIDKIEDAKKEIAKDPNNAEDIGKEIGILERQKKVAEENIEKIDTDLNKVKNEIKLISTEEMNIKRKAQKLTNDRDSLVVAPKKPLTENVPKINGITYAKKIDYRVIDINDVPKEYTIVTIEIDHKKIKEAIRLKGINLKIPGIEVYEKDIVRASSY